MWQTPRALALPDRGSRRGGVVPHRRQLRVPLWLDQVGGAWYYLDAKTKAMVHGRTFSASGKTYVAEDSGVCPANAWAEVKGKWYLTDATCACRSGWVVFDGTTYYFDPKTKVMKQYESFTVNGKAYLAIESGAIAGGSWNETARGWYYTTVPGCSPRDGPMVNGVCTTSTRRA